MPEDSSQTMHIEVVYALPASQTLVSLVVAPGTTAIEAVIQSGLLEQHQLSLDAQLAVGIFGKKVRHDTPLQAMDRVEIYRPLIANAKEARRLRAASQKKSNKQKN